MSIAGVAWVVFVIDPEEDRTGERRERRFCPFDMSSILAPDNVLAIASSPAMPQRSQPRVRGRVSVIIPTLNEAWHIVSTVRSAQAGANTEVIVVDGHSRDGTAELARSCGARVVSSGRGRARQMNAGTAYATGQWLLFLHADTRLPRGFDRHVRRVMGQPGVVGGAFGLKINGPGWGLRLIERAANLRSWALRLPYGDQAIFLTADVFHQLGGYRDQPLMEDFSLVRCLARRGRVRMAPASVRTSGRRWASQGLWRTTLLHQAVAVAYCLGVSPSWIAKWRKDVRVTV